MVMKAEVLQPQLRSEAAALYDFETGALLFSKAGDTSLPPASMTKLMTLHLTYQALEEGLITPETLVRIDDSGDFRNLPRRSSLMFLESGQDVTVRQLMQGLAVPSGNDAALVLARLIAGSEEAFVDRMNRECERLGLEKMHFVDPAGLSENNSVTPLEFGRFCMYYIEQHPEALRELHNLARFTYPTEQDISEGEPAEYGPVTQENYNILIDRHPWVDGLKTGYIDESGYNIALTAEAGGRRLVGVLMGGPGTTPVQGALTRAIDGTNLLSYGFYAFERVLPAAPEPELLRVWKGEQSWIAPAAPKIDARVLPREDARALEYVYDYEPVLIAPISEQDQVGTLTLISHDRRLIQYPLFPERSVARGGWFRVLIDSIILFFKSPGN